MSGAEAATVLGVISAVISIVTAAKQVYDTTTNSGGLPDAFREVAKRLPFVLHILDTTSRSIDFGYVDENLFRRVKPIVLSCREKVEKLRDLFERVIPGPRSGVLTRYYNAVEATGRGSEVEKLMKGILEDLQLLSCRRGLGTASQHDERLLVRTKAEISAIEPSVPAHIFNTTFGYGSGSQLNLLNNLRINGPSTTVNHHYHTHRSAHGRAKSKPQPSRQGESSSNTRTPARCDDCGSDGGESIIGFDSDRSPPRHRSNTETTGSRAQEHLPSPDVRNEYRPMSRGGRRPSAPNSKFFYQQARRELGEAAQAGGGPDLSRDRRMVRETASRIRNKYYPTMGDLGLQQLNPTEVRTGIRGGRQPLGRLAPDSPKQGFISWFFDR